LPGAIGSLILSAAIAGQAPPAAVAPAESTAALVAEMQAFALAHGKYDDTIPASILEALNLNGGKAGYAECLVAWQDDDDNSYHAIVAGLDKQNLIFGFKPADNSYSINWRVDPAGKLLSTVRTDKSGIHELANDLLADRFNTELDYWKVHLPEEEKARAGRPPCAPPA
jgi:hypothetical protein